MDQAGAHLTVAAGRVIFFEGEPGASAFVIEAGTVEISIDRDGGRVVLGRRGAGEVVGEMAIIDAKPRSATATAVTDCRLLVVTAEQLTQRIARSDPVLRMCLNTILERFRATLAAIRTAEGAVLPSGAPAAAAVGAEHAVAIEAIKLEQELRRGLGRQEFVLHYQPMVVLDGGAVAGFEALARWQHPERGLVPPGAFIPTAEASGLIVPLGRWALGEACAAIKRLGAAAGGAVPFVSVNASGRDLRQPDFVARVVDAAESAGLAAGRLKLEITESVLVEEPRRAAEALRECRAAGVRVAIDDFGTGYSGLSYLLRFPIDTLKIDRSFVQGIAADAASRAIVRWTISLARELGLSVVAEGVEDQRQAAILRDLGCTYAQGFLYSRPVPEAAAAALLVASPSRGPTNAPSRAAPPPTRARQRAAAKPSVRTPERCEARS